MDVNIEDCQCSGRTTGLKTWEVSLVLADLKIRTFKNGPNNSEDGLSLMTWEERVTTEETTVTEGPVTTTKVPGYPRVLVAAPLKFTDPALSHLPVPSKTPLYWCRMKTKSMRYALLLFSMVVFNVQLDNFSSSWADDSLLRADPPFLPDAFDYHKLTPKDRRQLRLAFKVE
nr:unnamed protein product [Callosobruchus analis]